MDRKFENEYNRSNNFQIAFKKSWKGSKERSWVGRKEVKKEMVEKGKGSRINE